MAPNRALVLAIPGLTQTLLDHAPALARLAQTGGVRRVTPVLPALGGPMQATFATGIAPAHHGCVADGWYQRDMAEIRIRHPSGRLIEGETLWQAGRRLDPAFTSAHLFWRHGCYTGADIDVAPRSVRAADGRLFPMLYTAPADVGPELVARLGPFPHHRLWGPKAGVEASVWIANALLHVYETRMPTLTLGWLPHLDIELQRLGPEDRPPVRAAVAAVDALCAPVLARCRRDGTRIIVLSEYGMTAVRGGPIPLNRVLREAGLLQVYDTLAGERLDPGASAAFAVCDHQIAHVYVHDRDQVEPVRALLAGIDGVDAVLAGEARRQAGLDHPRAGELVAISAADRWFSYAYWLDPDRAPDFARSVDGDRKPGVDPGELFPDRSAPRLDPRVGDALALDLVPREGAPVRGSHGRLPVGEADSPVLIGSEVDLLPAGAVAATAVRDIILRHVFGRAPAAA